MVQFDHKANTVRRLSDGSYVLFPLGFIERFGVVLKSVDQVRQAIQIMRLMRVLSSLGSLVGFGLAFALQSMAFGVLIGFMFIVIPPIMGCLLIRHDGFYEADEHGPLIEFD